LQPERLAELEATALLDSPVEEAFDRFTRLASVILNTPVLLVSLVDRDRQFFKSSIGLKEPWASSRQTPLSHSSLTSFLGGLDLTQNMADSHQPKRMMSIWQEMVGKSQYWHRLMKGLQSYFRSQIADMVYPKPPSSKFSIESIGSRLIGLKVHRQDWVYHFRKWRSPLMVARFGWKAKSAKAPASILQFHVVRDIHY
jgi:hypothetical protein